MKYVRLVLTLTLLAALSLAGYNIVRQLTAIEIAGSSGGIKGYDLAISWDPSNPSLYASRAEARARVLAGSAEGNEVLSDLESARSLNPYNWNYLLRTGQVLELLGKSDQAAEVYEHLAEVSPSDATDEWQLANYYLRNGEMEQALGPLREALIRDPGLGAPALSMLTQLRATRAQVETIWPDDHRAADLLVIHAINHWEQVGRQWGADFLQWAWGQLLRGSRPVPASTLNEYVRHLQAEGHPTLAREAWIGGMARNGLRDPEYEEGTNRLWNGDFSLRLADGALGWRTQELEGLRVKRISDRQGGAELEFAFTSDSNPVFRHLRQTLVVVPGQRYRLQFRARSERITSDQGLYFAVEGPSGPIAQTDAVRGTTRWRKYETTFRFRLGPHSSPSS